MPSGSGSGWSRMPTFSREPSSSRISTTRCRFSRWSNSSSKSSRISERRRPRRRQGCSGRSPESSLSESTRSGAIGTVSPITPTAVRTKPISSLTTPKTSPSRGSSFAMPSTERPPGSARKPGGRTRVSSSRGTQNSSSFSPAPMRDQSRASSAPSHTMMRRSKDSPGGSSARPRTRAILAGAPGRSEPYLDRRPCECHGAPEGCDLRGIRRFQLPGLRPAQPRRAEPRQRADAGSVTRRPRPSPLRRSPPASRPCSPPCRSARASTAP